MGQECCAEEPTTERDGRGGGLFRFGRGKEKGEHDERDKGLWPGFKVTNAVSAYNVKVRCKQVQLRSRFGCIRGQSTNGDFLRVDSSL